MAEKSKKGYSKQTEEKPQQKNGASKKISQNFCQSGAKHWQSE